MSEFSPRVTRHSGAVAGEGLGDARSSVAASGVKKGPPPVAEAVKNEKKKTRRDDRPGVMMLADHPTKAIMYTVLRQHPAVEDAYLSARRMLSLSAASPVSIERRGVTLVSADQWHVKDTLCQNSTTGWCLLSEGDIGYGDGVRQMFKTEVKNYHVVPDAPEGFPGWVVPLALKVGPTSVVRGRLPHGWRISARFDRETGIVEITSPDTDRFSLDIDTSKLHEYSHTHKPAPGMLEGACLEAKYECGVLRYDTGEVPEFWIEVHLQNLPSAAAVGDA